jgi:hypothetical protein
MTPRPALGALAAAVLLLTACGPATTSQKTEAAPTQNKRDEWVNQQFSEERWGAPGVHRASAGIGPGSDGGLEFTPERAGRYDIGMACEGTSSIAITVASADGNLGSGGTDCGSVMTSTMELPVGKVTIKVEGEEGAGMWALAVAPADAPPRQ